MRSPPIVSRAAFTGLAAFDPHAQHAVRVACAGERQPARRHAATRCTASSTASCNARSPVARGFGSTFNETSVTTPRQPKLPASSRDTS